MGIDVTLHLVDEEALRRELVPAILGDAALPARFVAHRPDAAEMVAQARALLSRGAAEEAAARLCDLAVLHAACTLPHRYERGFALSLVEFPERLAGSPEALFAPVVRAHPRLAKRFPRRFGDDHATGVYV